MAVPPLPLRLRAGRGLSAPSDDGRAGSCRALVNPARTASGVNWFRAGTASPLEMENRAMNKRIFNGRIFRILAVMVSLAALPPSASAADFECSWRPVADGPPRVRDVDALIPLGDDLDQPAKLNAAVDTLRKQGMSEGSIIDNLIAAYCPTVAANPALDDRQKTARLRLFAARATGVIYSLEGADEIILDVPFSPQAVDAINAKAQAAGTTAQAWVAQIVNAQLER